MIRFKSQLLIILGISISALSSVSHAEGGSHAGNGGDAVVCRASSREIISAEALDVYEARVMRHIDLVYPGENMTLEEAYESLLSRLAVFSPLRAERYRPFLSFFKANWNMLDGELVDIPDSGHLSFETGCKVEQLIIQQDPQTPFDSRFLVQKNIWAHLSFKQQAVMVLHEAILAEARDSYRQLGWTGIETRGIRYLNSLVFGFQEADYYSKITEKMIVDAFLQVPNIYKIELRSFGEVVSRLHRGTQVSPLELSAVADYDKSGNAISILVLDDPNKKSTEVLIKGILFKTDYSSAYYKVTLLEDALIKVEKVSPSSTLPEEPMPHFDLMYAEVILNSLDAEKGILNFCYEWVDACNLYSDVTFNFITKKINAITPRHDH